MKYTSVPYLKNIKGKGQVFTSFYVCFCNMRTVIVMKRYVLYSEKCMLT